MSHCFYSYYHLSIIVTKFTVAFVNNHIWWPSAFTSIILCQNFFAWFSIVCKDSIVITESYLTIFIHWIHLHHIYPCLLLNLSEPLWTIFIQIHYFFCSTFITEFCLAIFIHWIFLHHMYPRSILSLSIPHLSIFITESLFVTFIHIYYWISLHIFYQPHLTG